MPTAEIDVRPMASEPMRRWSLACAALVEQTGCDGAAAYGGASASGTAISRLESSILLSLWINRFFVAGSERLARSGVHEP
ncbi:hypothetical protein ACFQUU_28260 [Herbaspirillum sp. GCM10030257]|uniref:hypothetical protein n=1 Tax=Herbaspirillum sp. GCM10030257 TaxID=3273393 RepID=UPI00361BFF51